MFDGACHCGALTLRFESALEPAALPVRRCGCTFCVKHQGRYTSDPAGTVTIRIADDASVSRYRFGLRLADFLICRTCGVFVAAIEPGTPGRAVINIQCLARAAEWTQPPTLLTIYDSEDVETRTSRRARSWTPAWETR